MTAMVDTTCGPGLLELLLMAFGVVSLLLLSTAEVISFTVVEDGGDSSTLWCQRILMFVQLACLASWH